MNFRKQKAIKFFKQLLLLFLISFTLYNCVDTETLIREKIDEFKTASLLEAKLMLLQHKRGKVDVRRKVGSALVIKPKWETIQYESLSFTDALVTKVEFDANIEIQETSKLFFIEVNNTLVTAIKTDIVEEYSADNKMKEGKILFHDLDGNYLDGYVIKKGKIKSKLVPKKKVQEAGFLALLLQLDGSGSCDGSLTIEQILAIAIENGGFFCFEEVEIGGGGSSGGSSGSNTNGDPTLDPNSGAYINFLDGAPEGNSGGGSSSGTGGVNNPEEVTVDNYWEQDVILFDNISDPVVKDVKEYLKCFNLSNGAELTLYVDQPIPNSSKTWTGSTLEPDVGHTFILISQGNITRVMGLYPKDGVNVVFTSDDGVLINNGGHHFDISISVNITSAQLAILHDSIIDSYSVYDLNSYNCTDFGIDMFNFLGFDIPDNDGVWKFGGGSNPGNLGQDLRKMKLPLGMKRNVRGGKAPKNNGGC